MRKLNTLFAALLVAAFIVPTLNSCKKGEEDPGISFKSRNKRVTGTWQLSSYEKSWTKSGTVKTTNDVNDDTYDEVSSSSGTEKFSGGKLATSAGYDIDYTRTYEWYQAPAWQNQEVIYDTTWWEDNSATWGFTISLYTDNTYEITETTGDAAGSWSYDWENDVDDDNEPPAPWNNFGDNDNKDDGTTSSIGNSTSISQGSWYWEEDTKKNKLYINAGMVRGKVIRLSNKDLWVEIQYAALGGQSENTSDKGTDTEVLEDISLLEYDDNNPADMKDGDITTVTTWDNTENEVMWVFTKTDKNSKRHKAGGN